MNSEFPSKSETLICFAVREEAAPFQRLLNQELRVRVLLTGMGRRNAEKALSHALAGPAPTLVLSAGFAGGLNPRFSAGTLLYEADPETHLQTALSAANAHPARFFCSDRAAVTPAEKTELHYRTGADAVEMESESIRELCRKQGIPSATVRVVLDAANDELPLDFNALMTSDFRLDIARLVLTLARSPQRIPKLLHFRKQVAGAASILASALHQVLRSCR